MVERRIRLGRSRASPAALRETRARPGRSARASAGAGRRRPRPRRPGAPRTRARKSCSHTFGGRLALPGCTVTLSTRSGVNPRSTCRSAMKLRRTSPAATSRTTDSPIWTTRSVERTRSVPRPAVERSPSSVDSRFALPAWRSGTAPVTSATTSTAANVKSATVESTAMSATRGRSSGARATIAFAIHCATARPSTPPATATSTTSDIHSRAMRAAGGAERQADPVFVPPARDARQHEARDVGARDQQQHDDRGPQHPERRTHGTEDVIDKRRRDRFRAPLQAAAHPRHRDALPSRRLRRARRPGSRPGRTRPRT